jgi:hypothetical protein
MKVARVLGPDSFRKAAFADSGVASAAVKRTPSAMFCRNA